MINGCGMKSWMAHSNGDINGDCWCPAECYSPLDPSWSWREGEAPIDLATLISRYYSSIGNGCN